MIWIPIIIAAIILAGTTVALLWDEIVIALNGKKLAVLGERGVGKTVLIKFLETGTIPEKYEQTVYAQPTEPRRFELKDLSLAIKKSTDVPGSKDSHASWKSITDDADIVLYLLRMDKLMEGDKNTKKRVMDDMWQIGSWLQDKDNPKEYPFFIIGTHCDLTKPDLTRLPEDQIGNYNDKINRMPIIKKIVQLGGGRNKVRVILGSLKWKRETEKLVFHIFEQVQLFNQEQR